MMSNTPGQSQTEELEQQDSSHAEPSETPVAESETQNQAESTPPPEAQDDVTATASEDAAPAAETTDTPEAEQSAAEPDEADSAVEADDAAETATSDAPEAEEAPITMEEVVAQMAEAPAFRRGDVVEATILITSPTSIQVDLDGKAEGVIPGRELERMNRETLDTLRVGETVPVMVVNPRDHNGNVIVSINRALEELDWQRAEEYRASQQVYEGSVAGYNKGGLIVRFGRVRGFVPQSQISAERRSVMSGETPEERWGGMVNDSIAVKVMEVDRSRNRLILSERAASREVRESRKENLISDLGVGEVRTGRVVSLVDFGAFVDIGGAEGLVHLTEMSWKHLNHPREMVKVGDEVTVEVISVDPERKRIGLSMKRQEQDPWDAVAINYNIGQLVQGTITKMTRFGAFARLVDEPEIEGLIHISELSDQRVNHPKDVVKEGDTLTLRVVKMDIENRRLGLSLKRVNSAEYMDLDLDWS